MKNCLLQQQQNKGRCNCNCNNTHRIESNGKKKNLRAERWACMLAFQFIRRRFTFCYNTLNFFCFVNMFACVYRLLCIRNLEFNWPIFYACKNNCRLADIYVRVQHITQVACPITFKAAGTAEHTHTAYTTV